MAQPLSVRDAALSLGVTPQRVRQLVTAGLLRAVTIDARTYLIEPASLAHYQKTRRLPGRPPHKPRS